MAEAAEVERTYITSRMRQIMKQNSWLLRRVRGIYEATDSGLEAALERLDMDLELAVAARLAWCRLTALGKGDVIVFRLSNGDIVAFRTEGAQEVRSFELELGLSPLRTWGGPEEVLDEFMEEIPSREERDPGAVERRRQEREEDEDSDEDEA